jgi:hypothetical protein
MAEKEEIYPKGYPKQTESFSDNQKFKYDVYEAIKEVALESSKKAFEDKSYKLKEDAAGEYATGEKYGKGTELHHFNIRLSSRPNTNTCFEKIIYFGGKEYIIEVAIGWDAKNKTIELSYKTPEGAAFRGYGSEEGPHMVDGRFNFVIKSVDAFKKDLKKMFDEFAQKEVAQITKTKMGIEDKTEKSINSMVEHMKNNKFTLSSLYNSSFDEVSDIVGNYINEARKDKESKESKEDDKDKMRMNSPEVVAANSPEEKILFDFATMEEAEEKASELFGEDYASYFKKNMEKYNVTSSNDLTPAQWTVVGDGWKSKKERKAEADKKSQVDEMTTAGPGAGSVGKIAYQANPFEMDKGVMKRKFNDTNYSKKDKKRSLKKEYNENSSAPYSYTVDLFDDYGPDGMQHNYVAGQHSKNLNEAYVGGVNYDNTIVPELKAIVGDLNKIASYILTMKGASGENINVQGNNKGGVSVYDDGKLIYNSNSIDEFLTTGINYKATSLKESLVKRKFTSLTENEEKGINKRYIVTEQRSQDEQKDRWKKLSLFETYETIHKAEGMCECMDECSCGGGSNYSEDDNLVTMDQGQKENERDFIQRNQDAESGEFVDGKEVIIVAKPKSMTNVMYKVFKDDFMNENKAYILDLSTGNLVNNPSFKIGR